MLSCVEHKKSLTSEPDFIAVEQHKSANQTAHSNSLITAFAFSLILLSGKYELHMLSVKKFNIIASFCS